MFILKFYFFILFLHFIFKAYLSIVTASLLTHLAHLINNFLFPAQQFCFQSGCKCVSFFRKSFELWKNPFFLQTRYFTEIRKGVAQCWNPPGLVKGHTSHNCENQYQPFGVENMYLFMVQTYFYWFPMLFTLRTPGKVQKTPNKKYGSVQKVAWCHQKPESSQNTKCCKLCITIRHPRQNWWRRHVVRHGDLLPLEFIFKMPHIKRPMYIT